MTEYNAEGRQYLNFATAGTARDPGPRTGDAKLPHRAHTDDAGYDLYTLEDTVIGGHEFVDVPTGVAVQLPADHWGLLVGRSSTLRKHGLLVQLGVIDTGYRGELFVGTQNLGPGDKLVKAGERLGQLILVPNGTLQTVARWAPGNVLEDHERGLQGFGSSGL